MVQGSTKRLTSCSANEQIRLTIIVLNGVLRGCNTSTPSAWLRGLPILTDFQTAPASNSLVSLCLVQVEPGEIQEFLEGSGGRVA